MSQAEKYEDRLEEVIGMIQHTYPDSHSFSKRYILEFLLDLQALTKKEKSK
jgi:hypothetical protein